MTRVVTALYDSILQAELALAHLSSEVGVEDGEIVDRSPAGRTRLARAKLSPEEQAACARKIERGGFLLIAQVSSAHDPDRIANLLRDIPLDGIGKADAHQPPPNPATGQFEGFRVEDPAAAKAAATPPAPVAPPPPVSARAPSASLRGTPGPARAAPAPGAPANPRLVGQFEGFWVEDPKAAATPEIPSAPAGPAPAQATVAEERIPVVEEHLRVDKREVSRGGARVHSHVTEEPVYREVELLAERASIERRPVGRQLSPEEVEQGGLLRGRVFEISEMREEAEVSKEAVVREEVVVRKTVHDRVEQIDDTVLRTEVEIEQGSRTPGERSAFPGLEGQRGSSPRASAELDRSNSH